MRKDQPEISILVASYKNPALLRLCLSSIKKNLRQTSYEVVVADGSTEEETFDIMRIEFPWATFIPNRNNVGFGKLINQCLEVARGKYFFIINADIIIKEELTIQELLLYLKKNPSVGLIGPRLINFDNTIQQSCFRFYSLRTILYRRTALGKMSLAQKHLARFMMKEEQKNDRPFEVDWLMGSALMTSDQAVSKVGKMDKRFFMYFEDVDWCWRFWENNLKVVYHPGVEIFHYHGQQSAGKNVFSSVFLNKYSRIHIRSAIKFFLKNLGKKNPHKNFSSQQNNGK